MGDDVDGDRAEPGQRSAAGPQAVSRAVEVVVAPEDVDLVSGLLWGAGVTAVAEHPEDPARDEPDGDPRRDELDELDEREPGRGGPDQGQLGRKGAVRVRLRADVPAGGVDAVRATLGHRWPVVEVLVADDGLDAWRAHARSVAVGRRLVVHPPWVPRGVVAADAVVLEIDPGRSFGHGAHPTTRLCLAALEEHLDTHPGATVLDVGCGSGVLAVAAARLGSARVVAVDIDPTAVAVTRANADRNGVTPRLVAALVPDQPGPGVDPLAAVDGPFDVVVANIGARALVALAPALRDRLAPGGTLVLSGLLDPPAPEVAAALVPLAVAEARTLDGWVALVVAST